MSDTTVTSAKLRRTRAGHRAHVTKLLADWKQLRVESEGSGFWWTTDNLCLLEHLETALTAKVTLLADMDNKVRELMDAEDEDTEKEIQDTGFYMDDVHVGLAVLRKVRAGAISATSQSSPVVSSNNSVGTGSLQAPASSGVISSVVSSTAVQSANSASTTAAVSGAGHSLSLTSAQQSTSVVTSSTQGAGIQSSMSSYSAGLVNAVSSGVGAPSLHVPSSYSGSPQFSSTYPVSQTTPLGVRSRLSAAAPTFYQTSTPVMSHHALPQPPFSSAVFGVGGSGISAPGSMAYVSQPHSMFSGNWPTYQGVRLGQSPFADNTVGSASSNMRVKLPKISLKSFSGRRTDWISFWETFASLIHNNPDLSCIDKFAYLKSVLKGEALSVVEGLRLSDENYDAAIQMLAERFGDPQRIVREHVDALLHLPAVTSDNDVAGLRALLDKVELNVRSLENLGRPASQYSDVLLPVLFNKLPSELRLCLTSKIPGSSFDLACALQQLQIEVDSRERATSLGVSLTAPSLPAKERIKSSTSYRPSTSSALPAAAITDTTTSDMSPKCVYCSQPHEPAKCEVVTSTDKRKAVLKKDGLCYVCLKKNHISRNCRSRLRCAKCQKRHHTSICNGDATPGLAATPNKPASTTVSMVGGETSGVLLQTAKAQVSARDQDEPCAVRLMLDGGSQQSYITKDLQSQLGLVATAKHTLTINPFGSECGITDNFDVVSLNLYDKDGEELKLSVVCVPVITAPIPDQYPCEVAQQYEHLRCLPLADDCTGNVSVQILLGADYYWQIVTGDVVRADNGPTAIGTRFGYVLSGPSGRSTTSAVSSVNAVVANTQSSFSVEDEQLALQYLLQQFWRLESLGIVPNEPSVHELFLQSIKHDGQRYQVNLPWRENHRALPDNFKLSESRLASTLKKLRANPDIRKEYCKVIDDQLSSGIVELVPESDAGVVGEVHYLPHHPVVRQDRATTKVRVVFDASAKTSSGPSLNDCLYAGPALVENIADILLRFRIHAVALVGDIEKAFLMISVNKQDRDVLRFLWVDDVMSSKPNTVTLRFTRVVFGVSSSPFLLNATIQHHMQQYAEEDPEFVKLFQDNLYVDDIIAGGNDVNAAWKFYVKSKVRLAEGGFNARKFMSSSSELQHMIAKHEFKASENRDEVAPTTPTVVPDSDSYAKLTLNGSHLAMSTAEKVLGIPWDRMNDHFVMDVSQIFAKVTVDGSTKRQVITAVCKVYDPLGFLTPVTITLKVFLQDLHRTGINWDDQLPAELQTRWSNLVNSVMCMPSLVIPRYYFHELDGEIQRVALHGFCDASSKAFAAVVYLVVATDNRVSTRLVAAKSRVAPLVRQTIPRLELLSALILARLLAAVNNAFGDLLPVNSLYCWSDSKVALYWIQGIQHDWKQFIHNRVVEIRRLTHPSIWRYCPTACNPADVPSRGVKPSELDSTSWLTGPTWLPNPLDLNGQSDDSESQPSDAMAELKTTGVTTLIAASTNSSQPSQVIDCTRYSSVGKVLRVTAYVLKFIDRLRKTPQQKIDATIRKDDLDRAETLWLKDVQGVMEKDPRREKWYHEFGVYHDEHGLLRCGGRLQNSNVPLSQVHPVLLHADHPFTALIVSDCHRRVLHNGVKETLTEVRSKYWIVKGRQFVRWLLRKCKVCKRLEGKPYPASDAPPLPMSRVTVDYPFTYTGVDFAGPLFIKQSNDEMVKSYIALYTCGVSRAVHLDLVPDLTADAFMRSFRRFIARFGVPQVTISDNAKTFKTVSKSLQALFDVTEVTDQLTSYRVKWNFNLEKAPWWGGFFERLVRCVKRCLKKTLHQARLTFEEMLTVLLEVEGVLNSRPLTYVSSEDCEEPLTPSHLMHGRRLQSLPDINADDTEFVGLSKNEMLRRMEYIKVLSDHFWSRWTKEYLLELRNAHRLLRRNRTSTPAICEGDVVLIAEQGVQRGLWRLALVESLIVGADGKARGAKLRSVSKSGKPVHLQRPVQLLYPVEVNDEESTTSTLVRDDSPTAASTCEPDGSTARSRRAAAQKCDEKRRDLIMSGAV